MSEFAERYWGRFSGCIRWEQAEAVAAAVADSGGTWYAVAPEDGPEAAVATLSAAEAAARLREHIAEMQRIKGGAYCNLVFVDEPDSPGLIKAFHPRRSGDACRVGGDPIPPWLLLSRYPVESAVYAPAPAEAAPVPLWRRVLRISS